MGARWNHLDVLNVVESLDIVDEEVANFLIEREVADYDVVNFECALGIGDEDGPKDVEELPI